MSTTMEEIMIEVDDIRGRMSYAEVEQERIQGMVAAILEHVSAIEGLVDDIAIKNEFNRSETNVVIGIIDKIKGAVEKAEIEGEGGWKCMME